MASTTGVVARWSITGLAVLVMAIVSLEAAATTGLTTSPPVVVESTRTGYRSLLALGLLDDGGHAVAWLGREASQHHVPWQLWVQRYDRHGRKSGIARQLAYADEPIEPRQIAATVRRDATVVVAWATAHPYQPNVPTLQVSTVHARHFGLDGKPRGPRRVLEETLWQHGDANAGAFEDLVVAHWRDGRYLVGWTVAGAWRRPTTTVQRLAADGHPLAPQDRLGPVAGRGLRLTPLEAGGWLATTIGQAADGHLHANITQVDVLPPMGLPLLSTLPLRSFVVDLGERGRLLLAGVHPGDAREPDPPWSLWFHPSGREADRAQPLPALPTLDVPLHDGTWIGLWPHPSASRLWAQRFDAQGAPLGAPLLTAAGRATKALALPGGGALIAWVGLGPDSSAGTNVFTQRVLPVP